VRFLFILLFFISVICQGQDYDTLIYVEKAKHLAKVETLQLDIDSLQLLLEMCRTFIDASGRVVVADTFDITLIDDRVRARIVKKGYNVWYLFEDGFKRINADYFDFKRKIMLIDSTYTTGSLYIR